MSDWDEQSMSSASENSSGPTDSSGPNGESTHIREGQVEQHADDETYFQEAETDNEDEAEDDDGDSQISGQEYEQCYLCGITIYCCDCPRCTCCHSRKYWCVCDNCANCTICGKQPYDCSCLDPHHPEVAVPGHIIQIIGTTDMATQRSRVRDVMDGETILLMGDLRNSHLLVIRKPSVILSSMYNATIGSLLSKWRRKKQSLSQMIKGTELYKRAKPWYDSASFYLERDVESTHINVKTLRGVRKMVTQLTKIPHHITKPTIGFDCEGVALGRYGTTCYIQIRDYTKGQTYLVDLLVLGQSAWDTPGEDSATTLRTIFESPNMVKIIFDVRGDSDALYKDYKIKLAGVLDVQYLAMLGRPHYYPYRIGFVRTMNDAACLSLEELQE